MRSMASWRARASRSASSGQSSMTHLDAPALPGADQVAHAPLLQVQLRDLEAVLCRRERLQPVAGRSLGHQDAEALVRPRPIRPRS